MTANPYTSQAISGYNSSPPTDDGAVTAANQVTWSGVKTKLGDPINTLAAAVNTQALAAFAKLMPSGLSAKTVNYTLVAADDSKLITWTPTATGMIIAPSATGFTAGFSAMIMHDANGDGLLLTTSGTATNSLNGAVNGSITLQAFQGGTLFTDAANWKFVFAGTATAVVSGRIRQTVSTFSSTLVSATLALVASLNFSDSLGTEVLSRAITPQSATTNLRISVKVAGAFDGAADDLVTFGLFATTATSALDAASISTYSVGTTANFPAHVSFDYPATSTATTSLTFSVRAAARTATQSWVLNGNGAGGPLYGGIAASHIIIQEY